MARPVSKLTNYKWPDFPENPPEMVRATYAGVFVEMARGLQQLVEGMCISRFMVMSVIKLLFISGIYSFQRFHPHLQNTVPRVTLNRKQPNN